MPDHATSSDPAVQAQLDRFAQLSPGRDVLGLERITALLALLGDPQHRLPPVFHVAGTNGKGSTCAFLRAMLEAAGSHVHVYTSPHLVRFNERIRLAGTLIEDEALAPLLAEVLDAAEAQSIGPSFFEATTAAAFLAFSRTPADACVIEVGLGGRLDATNIVRPAVTGIAAIGLDHQAFLGNTLAEMGAEKAGIAKPGVPLVTLAQPPEAMAAIEVAAARAGAPLLIEGRDWQIDATLTPALPGPHQLRNANLAVQMLKLAQYVSPGLTRAEAAFGTAKEEEAQARIKPGLTKGLDDSIRKGLTNARWPARFQKLAPGPLTHGREIWIDGAHNPAAAEALAATIAGRGMHVILGILANKDADGIIAPLKPHAASLTFVDVPGHASHDRDALARKWRGTAAKDIASAVAPAEAGAARVERAPTPIAAPASAGATGPWQAPILIAGSLYLAGEALRLNDELPD